MSTKRETVENTIELYKTLLPSFPDWNLQDEDTTELEGEIWSLIETQIINTLDGIEEDENLFNEL